MVQSDKFVNPVLIRWAMCNGQKTVHAMKFEFFVAPHARRQKTQWNNCLQGQNVSHYY